MINVQLTDNKQVPSIKNIEPSSADQDAYSDERTPSKNDFKVNCNNQMEGSFASEPNQNIIEKYEFQDQNRQNTPINRLKDFLTPCIEKANMEIEGDLKNQQTNRISNTDKMSGYITPCKSKEQHLGEENNIEEFKAHLILTVATQNSSLYKISNAKIVSSPLYINHIEFEPNQELKKSPLKGIGKFLIECHSPAKDSCVTHDMLDDNETQKQNLSTQNKIGSLKETNNLARINGRTIFDNVISSGAQPSQTEIQRFVPQIQHSRETQTANTTNMELVFCEIDVPEIVSTLRGPNRQNPWYIWDYFRVLYNSYINQLGGYTQNHLYFFNGEEKRIIQTKDYGSKERGPNFSPSEILFILAVIIGLEYFAPKANYN